MNLLPRADQYTLNDLKGIADIIEEASSLVTYIGIVKPQTEGTDEQKKAAAIWTIIKVEQSAEDGIYPNVTTILFPDGIASFSKVWNDRATYDYTFKVF